ncbi:hypothetical protein KI387_024027, partial [Taxus chinensis]
MRRPSWNKSQAIQQVLSLKNLFHSTPDDDTNFLPQNAQEDEPSFHRLAAAPASHNNYDEAARKLEWIGEADLPVLATSPTISAKNVMTNSPCAQLTIFYCGNVNVYNDVPVDKAKAIMLLAGEKERDAESRSCAVNGGRSGSGCIPFPATLQKETPITRKASLQRFLEKKKDRSRCKRSGGASKKPPVLMGMFMHPSYWSEAVKKNPTNSSGNSPTRPPQTPSSDEQALIFSRRKS